MQIVGVACQCLCSLARLKPQHGATVLRQASHFYTALSGDYLRKVRNVQGGGHTREWATWASSSFLGAASLFRTDASRCKPAPSPA